jgi:hypothetical protein
MLGRSGGYIPESAAQQHIMRPFMHAIAYLHAQASTIFVKMYAD